MNMIRKFITPTEFNLKELPPEGRHFHFDETSEELSTELTDVVGNNPYSVDLEIQHLGNAYQVSGTIKTQMDLACSRCAVDFKFPVDFKVKEILMIEPEMPRSGKSARVNHSSELNPLAPDCTVLHSSIFNLGPFVRELIALAEPIQPLGKPDCDDLCENFLETQKQQQLRGSEIDLNNNTNPFAVLKDLKLNS